MTTFDDRERAFEAKYARDEDMAFRVSARRNRLLGQWAAAKMNLTPEDVIRKLLGDLLAAGVEVDDATIRQAISEQTIEARRQLMGEV
jgi:hypothetical protein